MTYSALSLEFFLGSYSILPLVVVICFNYSTSLFQSVILLKQKKCTYAPPGYHFIPNYQPRDRLCSKVVKRLQSGASCVDYIILYFSLLTQKIGILIRVFISYGRLNKLICIKYLVLGTEQIAVNVGAQ